jgi:hypothetical protein
MKRIIVGTALCITFLTFGYVAVIWATGITTGRPEPLWPWQVSTYRKLAESGDGSAQYVIANHYLARDNREESDFWFRQCLVSKEPICLYDEASGLFGQAVMDDFESKEREEMLNTAILQLDLAESKLKKGGLLRKSKIAELRKKILRALHDPSFQE